LAHRTPPWPPNAPACSPGASRDWPALVIAEHRARALAQRLEDVKGRLVQAEADALPKRVPARSPRQVRTPCPVCHAIPERPGQTFCSRDCWRAGIGAEGALP
jgi:hypothetical protein